MRVKIFQASALGGKEEDALPSLPTYHPITSSGDDGARQPSREEVKAATDAKKTKKLKAKHA